MLLSLWCVIAVVVLLGEGLEGRYDPQSVSRHHRHRHYQTRERDLVASRGGSRRYDDDEDENNDDWDGTKNNDFYERPLAQHRPAAFERVFRDRHRRRGATSSGWYERRQVGGRGRQQVDRRFRPDYYGSTSSKWRIEGPRHVSLGGRGNRGGWSRHDPGIYSRRWPRTGYPRSYEDSEEYDDYDSRGRSYDDWYYDDEEAEDSTEYRRARRKRPSGSRRRGHADWRRERRPPHVEEEESDEAYYDDYDYEEPEPIGKRKTARDRTADHGRRDGVDEKKDEDSGHRGSPDQRRRKKQRHEGEESEEEVGSEDLNEVDEGENARDEDVEEEEEQHGDRDGDEYPWNIDDNDILDEFDEPSREVKKLPLTLNEIIQKLTSDLGPTTSEASWRRNHGSAGTEKRQGVVKIGDSRNSSNNQRGSRIERKKNTTDETSTTSTTSTTATNTYSKFTVELDQVTEATLSTTRSDVTSVIDTTPSSVISVVRENEEMGRKKGTGDLEMQRKSLDEEDFEAYENDDGEDEEEEEEEDDDEDEDEGEGEKRDYSETDDHRRDKESSADREPDYAEDEDDGDDVEEDSDDSQVPATTSPPLPWFELPQFSDRTSKMIHKGRIHARHERLLSTRSAMTSTTEYPKGSDLSQRKWEYLGNRPSIEMTRRSMVQTTPELSKAFNNFQTVSKEGSCRWPGKRVIPVKDVYPSPAKTYLPHCVILHRCTDDTGCCRADSMTCVPKHEETVELYFYSTIVLGNTIVEKLKFSNHTECQCIRIRKSAPPPQNITQGPKWCTCPSHFVAKVKKDQCECHCPENSQPCTRLRRGKDTFSVEDNTCITRGTCTSPTCEFGEYMSEKKRCLNRAERQERLSKHFETRNDLQSKK